MHLLYPALFHRGFPDLLRVTGAQIFQSDRSGERAAGRGQTSVPGGGGEGALTLVASAR